MSADRKTLENLCDHVQRTLNYVPYGPNSKYGFAICICPLDSTIAESGVILSNLRDDNIAQSLQNFAAKAEVQLKSFNHEPEQLN